ncbi:YceI family protein [Streptomyces sp. ME01-24h]|nr:YceI family protein [Streptomyces sp. ME19-03-3]MDX3352580.1 YceI family protein [Streptomyces sp. ME01-24h]
MPVNRAHTTVPGAGPHRELTGAYVIDPVHSVLGFSVRHAMVAGVRGRFTAFEGFLRLDALRPARSEAHVSVQAGSLDTGVRARDSRIAGPGFLDSATFPLMVFRSTAVVALHGDGNGFRMTGNLRIKDVELPLHIDLGYRGTSCGADGQRRIGFAGSASLRRSDYALGRNVPLGAGGVLLGDKVRLELGVRAMRLGPEAL